MLNFVSDELYVFRKTLHSGGNFIYPHFFNRKTSTFQVYILKSSYSNNFLTQSIFTKIVSILIFSYLIYATPTAFKFRLIYYKKGGGYWWLKLRKIKLIYKNAISSLKTVREHILSIIKFIYSLPNDKGLICFLICYQELK